MQSDDMFSSGDSGSSPYSVTSTSKQPKTKNPKYAYDRNKDKKPKRNKSAFILFSSDARAKLKAEKQDNGPNSNEIMVQLASLWKNLSKPEKDAYKQKALEDKKRYHRELEDFWKANPLEVLENKTRRNHVKKPSSAYGLYLREMKDVVKRQQPGIKMAAVMKILGEKWKSLDDKTKASYQAKAKKEQQISREKLGKHFSKHEVQTDDLFKKTKQRQQTFMRKKVKLETVDPSITTEATVFNYPEQHISLRDSFDSQCFPELAPLQTIEGINADPTLKEYEMPRLTSFPEFLCIGQQINPLEAQNTATTETANNNNAGNKTSEEPMIRMTSNLFPSDQSKETGDSNLLFKLLNQPLLFQGESKLDLLNFDSQPGKVDGSSLKLFGNSSFKAFLSYEHDAAKQDGPKLSRADIFNNAIMRALDKDALEMPELADQYKNNPSGFL